MWVLVCNNRRIGLRVGGIGKMSEYLIVDLRNKPELKELAAEWEIVGTFLLSRGVSLCHEI